MLHTKTIALGLVALLGIGLSATTATDAVAAISPTAYAAGNFEFMIEGLPTTTISSLDGGTIVADVVSESALRGGFVKKRVGSTKFDPLVVTMSPTRPYLDWINASFAGTERPRNGSFSQLDMNRKEVGLRTYGNLRLAGVDLSALSTSDGKSPLELKITAVGDRADDGKASGQLGKTATAVKKQPLVTTSFRVTMPGLDTSKVTSVSAISVKMQLPSASGPAARELRGGKAEIAPFSITFAETPSDTSWRSWYQSFVVNGKNSDTEEKTMTIEVLSQDLKTVLFSAKLEGVGIVNLSPTKTEARSEVAARLQADLYAESIRFTDGPGGK